MSQLSVIRQQVLDLLRETSTDTQFTPAQLNNFINLGLELAAAVVEWPRKQASINSALGIGAYLKTLWGSDFLSLIDAYYGDPAINGDIKPLLIVTPETLKQLQPRWMDSSSPNYGRPQYIMTQDQNNLFIFPRPDANNSPKPITIWYVNIPPALVNDTDVPVLPLVYHDIIAFYAAHVAYLNLGNAKMAQMMMKEFMDHHTLIRSSNTKEIRNMDFQWGADLDDVNADYPVSGNIIP